MCLMLYVATSAELATSESPLLRVEPVSADGETVRQVFSLPHVRFVGAHTGCSCGFPHIASEEPVEYFEAMFPDDRDEKDFESVRALLDLIRPHVSTGVEMYPVWNGEEALPPKGTIDWRFEELTVEQFFFIERFLYRVHGRQRDAPAPRRRG